MNMLELSGSAVELKTYKHEIILWHIYQAVKMENCIGIFGDLECLYLT